MREHRNGALLLVDLVVEITLEPAGKPGENRVPLLVLGSRTGNDQRRTGFVDQDRVDLVDDGVVMAALDEIVGAQRHVVAQVVETELVVRAVRDVATVGLAALRGGHLRQNDADIEPQEVVDTAHLLGLILGQVVVDGDDVHALAAQRVQVAGHQRDDRLAFTGLHLGDVRLVQSDTADHLHIERALAEHSVRCLAHGRKSLRKQPIEVFPVVQTLPEISGLRAQLLVVHRDEVVLNVVDLLSDLLHSLQRASLADTEQAVHETHGIRPLLSPRRWTHRMRAYDSSVHQCSSWSLWLTPCRTDLHGR